MKNLLNVFLVGLLFFAGGCSQRYSMERKLWFLEKEALKAIADPNQIVDAQLNELINKTDELYPRASSRGLGGRTLLLKAILLVGQGKHSEALSIADKLNNNRDKALFYNALGKEYMKRKDFQHALVCFRKGLFAVKGAPVYYRGLVDLYLFAKKAGKGDEYSSLVKGEYQKAVSSDKPVVRYMGQRGLSRFYLATGNLEDALGILKDIAGNKDYPDKLRAKSFIDSVLILLKEGKTQDARASLDNARQYNFPEELVSKVERMISLVEEKKAGASFQGE